MNPLLSAANPLIDRRDSLSRSRPVVLIDAGGARHTVRGLVTQSAESASLGKPGGVNVYVGALPAGRPAQVEIDGRAHAVLYVERHRGRRIETNRLQCKEAP